MKITLHLCKGCIEDLKVYNPYIDEKGNTILLKDMLIVKVPKSKCINTKLK